MYSLDDLIKYFENKTNCNKQLIKSKNYQCVILLNGGSCEKCRYSNKYLDMEQEIIFYNDLLKELVIAKANKEKLKELKK